MVSRSQVGRFSSFGDEEKCATLSEEISGKCIRIIMNLLFLHGCIFYINAINMRSFWDLFSERFTKDFMKYGRAEANKAPFTHSLTSWQRRGNNNNSHYIVINLLKHSFRATNK